jgi:DNA-binding transcriptional MerR regulator
VAGPPSLSIAEVARATGIPAVTLRFYEREIPSLFPIARTSGGHRRYSALDLEHFSLLRKLTAEQGLPFSRVREMFEKDADGRAGLRLTRLEAALGLLEQRVAELELAGKRRAGKGLSRLFRK